MKIETKKDLDLLVASVLENQNFENKKELFLSLRESALEFYISKGDLLPVNYSKLIFAFEGIDVDPHPQYVKHIEFFKNYYDQATLEEKLVISNFIFRMEILNGNFKESIKEYIQRWLIINIYKTNNNSEAIDFLDFFLKNPIDDKLIIETFKELIDIKYFLSLTSEERRSIFVNGLAVLWNNPSMNYNKIWLDIFGDLVDLLNKAIEINLIEDHMYIHFFVYHIYGNNIQTINEWKIFNEKIEKSSSKFYKEWGEINNLIKPKSNISKGKKKIAFLIDRMVLNSPMIVLYSLMKSLLQSHEFNENYEIYLYSMNYMEKNDEDVKIVNRFLSLGINFFTPADLFKESAFYYSHLEKALVLRSKIIEDDIDYLIGGGGYDIPIFLFATRTAPKQIFWSHGNCVSNLEGIDKRISHFAQECKEWDWKIFNIPIAEEFLVGSEEEKRVGLQIKDEYLKKFGKDTVILGTIGRLVKIESEEYLKTVAQVMKQNPNTIYLACGDGNIEIIKKKIAKYGIDENRFIFIGKINPHVYGWVIDVWPDTFPLPQGNSKNEFQSKNGCVILYKKYYAKEDMDRWTDYFKNHNIKYLPLCDSLQEYIEVLDKAVKDNNFRKIVGNIHKNLMVEDNKLGNFIEIIR